MYDSFIEKRTENLNQHWRIMLLNFFFELQQQIQQITASIEKEKHILHHHQICHESLKEEERFLKKKLENQETIFHLCQSSSSLLSPSEIGTVIENMNAELNTQLDAIKQRADIDDVSFYYFYKDWVIYGFFSKYRTCTHSTTVERKRRNAS
jgi:hypothetical protein